MVQFSARVLEAEFLPRIKLDHFSAGLRGFLDRLEGAKMVEAVSLAAEREAVNSVFGGNFHFGPDGGQRQNDSGGGDQMATRFQWVHGPRIISKGSDGYEKSILS